MLEPNNRFIRIIILAFFVFLTIQVFCPAKTYAESEDDSEMIIDRQMQSGEIQKLGKEMEKHAEQGFKDVFPELDPQKIIEDAAKGKFDFSFSKILNSGGKFLLKEIYLNINILIKLIVLAVFCAVLKNLQNSFLSESVGELAFFTCYIVLVSIMMVSLSTALNLGKNIVDSMVDFMHSTIPILITLLASGGNLTSAGVFQPVLIMIVEISATIIKNVFMPLIFLSSVLSIVDNVSDKIQVSRLAKFIKQTNTWLMGLIMTIFIAVVSIQGAMGAVVDGVTGKTAKFAIGAIIPVAGKYLADAAEAVIGCTLLIKNAAGVAVMIGIISICTAPLLKIASLVILYRITCILVEPISEQRITNCINEMAGSMAFMLGIATSVAVMFLISVTAIIGASNISAMVR